MKKENYQLLRDQIQAKEKELAVTTDHTTTAHFYVRDEKKYPSVTQKLSLVKDQGLSNWRINKMVDYIYQHWKEFNDENLLQKLDEAKNAPQLEFENAGYIGNVVHAWREQVFGAVIQGEDWKSAIDKAVMGSNSPAVVSACRGIIKFVQEHQYIPVACELTLADHDLKLGGSLDDLGFVDGELAVVDLKTSNIGDKNSYYYQVALYRMMLAKNYGIRPKKAYILHVSKTDGTYNLIELKNMTELMKDAKLILKLYDALEKLTNSKKKERVIYAGPNTEVRGDKATNISTEQ